MTVTDFTQMTGTQVTLTLIQKTVTDLTQMTVTYTVTQMTVTLIQMTVTITLHKGLWLDII